MAVFDDVHPKIIESVFSFPEFVPTYEKSVYSICSFLRYTQFWNPATRLVTPIFDHDLKNFQVTFISMNLCQHPKNWLIAWIRFSDTVNLESRDQIDHTHFWPCPAKKFSINFNFREFVSTYKKWAASSICWSQMLPRVLKFMLIIYLCFVFFVVVFLTERILIYNILKYLSFIKIAYNNNNNLKILQSHWLWAFWPISQKQDFS